MHTPLPTRRHGLLIAMATLALLALMGAHPAQAQERTPFGVVTRLSGQVTATVQNSGERRLLALGQTVFTGERIETQAASEVLLRTEDEGAIALRPNAAVAMEQYSAERSERARWQLKVLGGGLRVVTGWIAQINRLQYRIDTPTATVGVRGTDHEPYVISLELAAQLQQPAGSYDKVNRGETVLASAGAEVVVPAGRVGFVPDAPRTRALGTVLLPALLEQVPTFYVAGQFDAELDAMASTTPDTCGALAIAGAWLDTLDGAVRERSATRFMDLFLPEALITAYVTTRAGDSVTRRFTRDELARTTLTALAQLSEYATQRLTVRADVVDGVTCQRLRVESLVRERGVRQGQPYQIESVETFDLQRNGDSWRAREASTRIR